MPGIIGKKIGMTRILSEGGKLEPVTVIELPENHIIQVKNEEKDGYGAYVVGILPREKFKVPGKKYIRLKEFRFEDGSFEKGNILEAEVLEGIVEISVTGTSKGKGFQGGIKRHNFHGLRATHGSKFRRAIGSTGTRKPRRTTKNSKMPGHMGSETVTLHKKKVIMIDKNNKLVALKGSIPGANKEYVYLSWK